MDTIFDDFNRTDGAPGGNWSGGYNPPNNADLTIVSNKIRMSNISLGAAFGTWNANDFGPALFAQLRQVTVTTFNAVGVILFGSAPTNTNWYLCVAFGGAAAGSQILKYSTPFAASTLTSEVVTTWAANDILRGEAIYDGTSTTTLRLYRNGVQLLTTTDTTYTSGRTGGSNSAASVASDTEWDDFYSGDLNKLIMSVFPLGQAIQRGAYF